MAAHLHPDRTSSTATRQQRRGRTDGVRPNQPGWRPVLAAILVVAALALALHLLYAG